MGQSWWPGLVAMHAPGSTSPALRRCSWGTLWFQVRNVAEGKRNVFLKAVYKGWLPECRCVLIHTNATGPSLEVVSHSCILPHHLVPCKKLLRGVSVKILKETSKEALEIMIFWGLFSVF